MTAQKSKTNDSQRVFGCRDGLSSASATETAVWVPPTVAQVAARSPLPLPPPRPSLSRGHQNESPSAAPTEAQNPTSASRTRPSVPDWVEPDSVQALVWQRPEHTAGVIRSLLTVEPAADDDLTPYQRIGILLVALGQEIAGEVMKFLSDHDIEEATRSIAKLKSVSSEMQTRVLDDLAQDLASGRWLDSGGNDFARGALEHAVGLRKSRDILERVAGLGGGFQAMKMVSPAQVAPYLSHEHPQTIALILSQLQPAKSAGILDQLSQRLQADVSYRLATLEKVTPAVLRELDHALEQHLREFIGGDEDVGGPKVLADILNLSGSSTETNVLDQFDAQDPETAESVRRMMFVFADLEHLDDSDLTTVLAAVDEADLACALKATPDSLKAKIQRIVSESTWKSLAAEMEQLGPMRAGEVEQRQQRIVARVRDLENEGKITVVRGDTDDNWV